MYDLFFDQPSLLSSVIPGRENPTIAIPKLLLMLYSYHADGEHSQSSNQAPQDNLQATHGTIITLC